MQSNMYKEFELKEQVKRFKKQSFIFMVLAFVSVLIAIIK